jgi:hypothetical protein
VRISDKQLYLVVAACAVVVHLGSLWNRFAMDDNYIILLNPLVHSASGIWQAFLHPYWPADFGGKVYRPLVVATYAVDWQLNSAMWFHAVNLLWHAGAAVAVTALAKRFSSTFAPSPQTPQHVALAAGLLFAVHPVHVEAIANAIGRAELMAAAFAVLAVYAAVVKQSVAGSLVALTAGLLSKENAAVAPALIMWAWILELGRPSRAIMGRFVVSWVLLAVVYGVARWIILHPYAHYQNLAPVFVGQGHVAVRLTGIAALADMARLLVFPLALRVDYSPAERTIVHSLWDGRFALGLLCLAVWVFLVIALWRRRRRIEAFGIGWIGIALLPVANLLFPVGVVVAERTLYLPTVGLALAFGAWLGNPGRAPRVYWGILALIVGFGAIRSAVRVPVWRSDLTVTISILDDSPRSYVGPARSGSLLLANRQPQRALAAFQQAIAVFEGFSTLVAAADAAFASGQPELAHRYMDHADRLCVGCPAGYRLQAEAALGRGDRASADSLLAHDRLINPP